jgi:hypothetical protein
MPGAAVDAVVRKEARAAAQATRVAFVPLSASNERAMSALVAKTAFSPIPRSTSNVRASQRRPSR